MLNFYLFIANGNLLYTNALFSYPEKLLIIILVSTVWGLDQNLKKR